MPARRGDHVRPLLNVWRADIVKFLELRGITALEDPANSNRRFARVRMRRDVLPALERDLPDIQRRLHALAQRSAVAHAETSEAAARALAGDQDPVPAIRRLPQPVAAECMRILYRRAGGAEPGLGRSHIEAMLRLVASGPGGRGLDLPGGLRFRVVGSRAEVVPCVVPLMEMTIQARPCSGCDDAGAAHLKPDLELSLGFRRPGMRMRLRRGTRKLQDIFVDARVPREERDAWPLVLAGERIAWVPGVAVDDELAGKPGEPSLHVTVTRILSAGARKTPC
jgi:tRNA(Ile)-lysidine synthase